MKTATLTIELFSWWHAGSGLGRGGDADALVIRDQDDLPYLPGKTVKGLLRDAVQLAEDHKAVSQGSTNTFFGEIDPTTLDAEGKQAQSDLEPRDPGLLTVTSAALARDLAAWLRDGGPARKAALFETVSSTALNKDGVARDATLRTVEVCPPLTLSATVSGPDDGAWLGTLKQCVPLIRSLGSHRHRGLGRCQVALSGETSATAGLGNATLPASMAAAGCVWLEIKLLNDVIVSLSAATTGGHDSLDYLPGSVLLGAAAKVLSNGRFDPGLFLSGKVRFGDGLPLAPDGTLGWPVPLNCFFIKKEKPVGPAINALLDTRKQEKKRIREGKQAQQLRTGHLTTGGMRFELGGDYLLKTALDRTNFGRAKDRQLFEYETLPADRKFLAAIRWNASDDALKEKVAEIVRILTGPGIALGRSRSAQFGQVEITVAAQVHLEPTSKNDGVPADEDVAPKYPLHFYLASDLALVGAGGARLVPEPTDFGLSPDDWRLIPDRTFLRTRRYSPWNAFHHSRLTERQVIARGSVLTFARKDGQEAGPEERNRVRQKLANGVGEHCAEGLGCVLFNPEFVLALPVLSKPPEAKPLPASTLLAPPCAPVLADWVERRQTERALQTAALKQGQHWAEEWLKIHKAAAKAERIGRSGRRQWNEVRQRAIRTRGNATALLKDLAQFCEKDLRQKYWTHPVGKRSLWDELQAALNATGEALKPAGPGADKLPRGPLVCAALAAAAETIVWRLQKKENSTEPQDSKHQAQRTEVNL